MHMLHTAAQQHPSWIFCNATAALAHGLYASYWRVRPPHILVQRGAGGGPTGAARRHEGAADDVEVVGSLRVTSLRRTAVDCMRTLCPEEALAIADSTLRKTGATNEELSEWVKRYGAGKKGVNNAMEAALLANPLSENGGESMARSIMIRSGFVPPQLQVPFDNPAGGEPYRVDFYWLREDGRIVVGEFDGKEKYVEEGMTGGKDIVDVVLREKERESIVSDFNVRVFRFTFQDIMHPERLVQKMVQAGVPRLWWRA